MESGRDLKLEEIVLPAKKGNKESKHNPLNYSAWRNFS